MNETRHTTVAGIPCIAVLEYCPRFPGSRDQPEEPAGYILKRICDLRGRPAPWLERKLTDAERDRILECACEDLRADREDEEHYRRHG